MPAHRADESYDVSSLFRELDGIEREDSRRTQSRKRGMMVDDDTDDSDWDEEDTLAALFEDKYVLSSGLLLAIVCASTGA